MSAGSEAETRTHLGRKLCQCDRLVALSGSERVVYACATVKDWDNWHVPDYTPRRTSLASIAALPQHQRWDNRAGARYPVRPRPDCDWCNIDQCGS